MLASPVAGEIVKFKDLYVNPVDRFSLGIEEQTGQYFVSFPVSNGLVDYEEYYALKKEQFEQFRRDPAAAIEFVSSCRAREKDDLLLVKPGSRRGAPA
jgi:hypothetical protein